MDASIPHIGAALRYVRQTLRLKIELVANEAGCAPSNLSRIENGRQMPSVPLLEALARALQVGVGELYGLVETNPDLALSNQERHPEQPSAREWLEIRRRLDSLSVTRRKLLLQQLDALTEAEALEHFHQARASRTRLEMPEAGAGLARLTGS